MSTGTTTSAGPDRADALRPVGRPGRPPAQEYRPLLGWAVTDALTVTRRNLVGQLRQPQILVFAAIQPIMFTLLFRYVFGGAITVPGVDYVDYLMAGVFVQTVVFGGIATAVGLTEDLASGVVDRFRSLPMARSAVLTGRVLADVARNLLSITLMVAVGLAVGFRPDSVAGLLAAVGLLLLLGVAFSWYYALVGLVVGNAEAAQAAGFLVIFPLTFASSAFVPTGSMPGWLRAFADNQPITAAIDAIRALVLGQPLGEVVPVALAWIAAITVVMAALAITRYRRAR
ncbi:ABC-2 type transport system permease protein/oleandomycin transport system permease protein [Geodermatophilus pulveris]|uniref:Transport permease protein n=1 Tax=Geodermatophilus pulveris TaxID=1564159 RepID=A0A239FWS6_9ACTN|nr:ABC transporter permease [Geodermatophilus pulveris]SNS61185.1 ABC-2 type transport system permease protein/oleandomycin transport system permease protein [Geodermatophilus pulveris]